MIHHRALTILDHVLGDVSERLQVAPDDRVHEQPGLLLGVPGRHVDHVGLHNHGASPVGGLVEGCHGPVVGEPVVAAHDAEADDVPFVVKDLEPLPAHSGGKARDHVDLPHSPDPAVPVDDLAALDEVLVGLRAVEAAHHRPDDRHWGRDGPGCGRAALVRFYCMGMVLHHRVRHGESSRAGWWCLVAARDGGDSMELQGWRHGLSFFDHSLRSQSACVYL